LIITLFLDIPGAAVDEEDDDDLDEEDGGDSVKHKQARDSMGIVGQVKKTKRKNNDDIDDGEHPQADDYVATGRKKRQKLTKKMRTVTGKSNRNESVAGSPDNPRRTKRNAKKVRTIEPETDVLDDSVMDSNYQAGSSMSSESDSGNDSMDMPRKKFKASGIARKKTQRVRWKKEELIALEKGFQRHILNKRIPRQSDVLRVVHHFPVLSERTEAQIKSRVQHMINCEKKVQSSLLKKSKEKIMDNV
jgi:hypothetical protein